MYMSNTIVHYLLQLHHYNYHGHSPIPITFWLLGNKPSLVPRLSHVLGHGMYVCIENDYYV